MLRWSAPDRHCRWRSVLVSALACVFPTASASAEGFFDNFSIEYGFEVTAEYEGNVDLDRSEDADVGAAEAEISVAVIYEPNDHVEAEFGVVLGRDLFFVDEADEEKEEWLLEIDKANVTLSDIPVEGLTLSAGRMKIRDEPRYFLFDTTLDGVRATYETDAFRLDGSIARERTFDSDLLAEEEDNPRVNFGAAFLDVAVTDDMVAGPYFFLRDGDGEREGKLYYLGLRSSGEIAPGWKHWFDASHVSGDDGEIDVSGYALDVALTRVFDAPYQPSLTIGYAFGSGDDDPDDDTDHAYRQTGLHKNEARFNGIERFRYLGEVADPDLSNLHVFTLGAGMRGEDVSLDLVFHHYRLDEVAEELGDARIEGELRPQGDGKTIGNELDLVMGFENIAGFEEFSASIKAGYFWAGEAFTEENDDDAFFIGFNAEIAF